MITKEQLVIIDYLISIGYGWGMFAQSVKNSGNCSEKQWKTLISMKMKIQNHQRNQNKPVYTTEYRAKEKDDGEYWQGSKVLSRTYTSDGGCYTNFGGPCGPIYTDRNGEM